MNEAVYAKQYVRFAESVELTGKEALQHRLVQDAGIAAGVAATGFYGTIIAALGGEVLGVNQYSVPAVLQADSVVLPAEPKASRLAAVANSGLLLIRADEANLPLIGTAVQAKVDGTVDDGTAGAPVTFNGTDIVVREIIQAGGIAYALCSFS